MSPGPKLPPSGLLSDIPAKLASKHGHDSVATGAKRTNLPIPLTQHSPTEVLPRLFVLHRSSPATEFINHWGTALRYIDSGDRDPASALGSWFQSLLQVGDVSAVRWQTGFFTADGLGHLVPTLDRLRSVDGTVNAVIGSNNGDTLTSDIERVTALIGVPRTNARLGIASFSGAFFHPKVYHFSRSDGSQAAYVGSANLTSAGVGSLHVEAGVLLDTRVGDPPQALQQIADSIDRWFRAPISAGLTEVGSALVLPHLQATGILAAQATHRSQNHAGASGIIGGTRPRLQPLIVVPPLPSAVLSAVVPTPPVTGGRGGQPAPGGTPSAVQASARRTFMMTLQKTDVGVGQTTRGTSRRSPEIFVPLVARDLDPDFWGWPTRFIADPNWTGPRDGDGLGKLDRPSVQVRLGGSTIPVHFWYNPDKRDLRLRSEHLRSAGSVGDILCLERSDGTLGFDYAVEVIGAGSPRHATLLGQCNHTVRNSRKLFGYI